MTAAELAADIMQRQRASRLARHSRPWQPTATPASVLGYRCERRIVYQRTRPLDGAPIGEELASIFAEGTLHERALRVELAELGYEIVEAESSWRDATLDLVGHIDGRIIAGDKLGGRRIPVEIKSTVGDKLMTAEQWRDSSNKLLARYYSQLQAYLFLTSEPEGLGIFKDKITGLVSVVAAPIDYAHCETLLRRAERVRDAVRAGKLPERIADRSECSGCPWKDTVCLPAESPCDPMLLVQDEGLGQQLDELDNLDAAAERHAKLDAAIKERFKLTAGAEFVIGGRWRVSKKQHGKGVRIVFERLSQA